jgi:heptosyltransferase-2
MAAQKILVVGPAWIGDMVMAQAMFKRLQERNADVSIDVLAPEWSEPLLERMPEVNRAIRQSLGHGEFGLFKRRRLGLRLKSTDYDQAIVIPRSFKSALLPWFADIPVRTGFLGEQRYGLLNDIRQLDKNVLDQTVKRYLALGGDKTDALPETPQPKLEVDEVNRERVISLLGLSLDAPVVAFMPGAAYGSAKCWPLEHYAQLAQALVIAGMQVWVLGSDQDRVAGNNILEGLNERAHNLCGRTLLEDTVVLLSLAQATVTNDSGLMHVAAAVNSHVVAIYGSTSPSFTPPLTANKTILYKDIECSPCFKRECPLSHLNCLREIKSEQVFRTVADVIAGS